MRKIPTAFVRDPRRPQLVTSEWAKSCWWVSEGKGVPTLKVDGTACMVKDGQLFKRRELKQDQPEPEGFVVAGFANNKVQGWMPCSREAPEDRYHFEAWDYEEGHFPDGTYELIGPKVQGNPQKEIRHRLVRHGGVTLRDCERTFDGIRRFLQAHEIEGIVWHRETEGRTGVQMAKIKRRDFGLPWPPRPAR